MICPKAFPFEADFLLRVGFACPELAMADEAMLLVACAFRHLLPRDKETIANLANNKRYGNNPRKVNNLPDRNK